MTNQLTRKDFPILKNLAQGKVVICGYPITQAQDLQDNLNKVLVPDLDFVTLDYDRDEETATYTLKHVHLNERGTTIFDTENDAKTYWGARMESKYQSEFAIVNHKDYVLCCTCLAYEDDIWGHCNEVLSDREDEDRSYDDILIAAVEHLSDTLGIVVCMNRKKITQDDYDQFCDIIAERDEECRDGWEEDEWEEECLTYASSLFRDLSIRIFERVSGYTILDIYDTY